MINELMNYLGGGGETYYTPLHVWASICQPNTESALANPPFKSIQSKEYQP